MNADEQQLAYPQGQAVPAPGRAVTIAPGVKWLRMGLPFALDHINLWLLRDAQEGPDGRREGWTVVDCGIADESTRKLWEQVFAQELEGLPVLRLIVTHMHPDHIGLAHWLAERWARGGDPLRLWISATDWNAARMAVQSTTGFGGEPAAQHFSRHGVRDPATLDKVRGRSNYFSSMVPAVPASYRRLMEGTTLDIGGRTWRCIAGYGHAPEHISLFCADIGGDPADVRADAVPGAFVGDPSSGRGIDEPAGRAVLISGDMLLPRISTNVSVIDLEPEADPLRLYLESLDRLRELPADTLVLPSHGRPFVGAHTRIDQLHAHHHDRLAEVMEACARTPQTAFDLLPVLFRRPLDLHQTTFALGEAIAHLHALWFAGRLQRQQDAMGVYRFAPA